LADTPVVALLGPRQCGKSTLAQLGVPGRHCVSFDDETLLRTAGSLPPTAKVVTILCDRAERYYSTKLFAEPRTP
jgi:ABC-type uncharacterized transport system YnjBCD ATPase subunit